MDAQTPDLRIVADGLRFPEGPVALADGGVALVEIAAGRITRVSPDGVPTTLATPGGGPNGLAAGPDGSWLCCDNGGFAWHETPPSPDLPHGRLRPIGQAADYAGGRLLRIGRDGAVSTLYDRCGDHPLRGPNDLVPDGAGGVWFTDLGKVRPRDRDHGGVYWAALDGGRIVEAAWPIQGGANGIGLSPDGRTLYAAETEAGRLWSWPVLGPGVLGHDPWPAAAHGGRLVCQLAGYRRLDSLAVTAAGTVVVGTLGPGELTAIDPDGAVRRVVRLPDPMPTNLCFGGPGRRTAFVTLSTTGRLAALDWDEPGLALPFG